MNNDLPHTKLWIGLTGGIGSGKSTAAIMFRECGAATIDSDVISHQLSGPGGDAIPAIRAEFGTAYVNASGAMDRVRMRQLVFSDIASKQRLEAILHPLIRAQLLAEAMLQDAGDCPYLVLAVPLLLESGAYRKLVQRVLVVDCAESTQIARSMQRSDLQEAEVRAIMAHQLARTERLREADDILHNDSDLTDLKTQVLALHQDYLARR